MELFDNIKKHTAKATIYGLLVSTACGVIFGYGTAIIGAVWVSASVGLSDLPDNTNLAKAIFTAAAIFGAFLGSPIFGFISDKTGRKIALFIGGLLCLIGTLFSIIEVYWVIVAGRFVYGLSLGGVSSIGPLYQTEMTHPKLRGFYGAFFQFSVTFAIFLSAFGAYVPPDDGNSWRTMLIMILVPSIFLLGIIFFCPESPRYMVGKDKESAIELFKEILGSEEAAEREYDEIEKKNAMSIQWTDLIKDYYPQLLLGCLLAAAQQLTGVNAIFYYFSDIFKEPYFAVIIFGWNCLTSMLAIPLTGRFEPKWLLVIGLGIITASLAGAGLTFLITDLKIQNIVLVVFIMIFIAGFEISVGPLFFIAINVIFPENSRGIVVSIMTGVLWGDNFIISVAYPFMRSALQGKEFFIFAGVGLFSMVIVWAFLPEIKGKTFEEIEFGKRD